MHAGSLKIEPSLNCLTHKISDTPAHNKKPPHISVWGFGIKSLAVSYSHMIESHYHRR